MSDRVLPLQSPTITTRRLTLRLLCPDDAAAIQRLAGAKEVADTTLRIPHPYEDGEAERFIAQSDEWFRQDAGLHLAILHDKGLIGVIGFTLEAGGCAEVGYWIGVPYWNQGFATEALEAAVEFAFTDTSITLVHACHFSRNAASGRVLEKAGFHWQRNQTHVCMKAGKPEPAERFTLEREAFIASR
jgi:ribosomal-protein-alanine N-acetyltransferase